LTNVATKRAREMRRSGGHVMANGGNLNAGDVTWTHYVHAAYEPAAAGVLNAALVAARHRQYLAAERRALTGARLVICNSQRTGRDVITRVGVIRGRADCLRDRHHTIPSCVTGSREVDSDSISRAVVLFVGALAAGESSTPCSTRGGRYARLH
jgi:hypothetical protein